MKPKDRPSRIFLSLLIFPFLFFAASSAFAQNIYQPTVQSHPQNIKAEIPPGWTVFRGQSGLIVIHPLGWTVQDRGKGAFLYYWRADFGNEIIGTETSSPDLPLHWLRQMRIID